MTHSCGLNNDDNGSCSCSPHHLRVYAEGFGTLADSRGLVVVCDGQDFEGGNEEVPVGAVLEITAWREVHMETQGAESGCRPSTDAGETTDNGLTRRLLQSVL
jgi:hypothetical protein